MPDRIRFTPTALRALAVPPKGERTVYDEVASDLGIRIRSSGAMSYFVRYRLSGGGRRVPPKRYTIGPVDGLSIEKARGEARRIAALARLGKDPAGEKAAKRKEWILPNCARRISNLARTTINLRPSTGTAGGLTATLSH